MNADKRESGLSAEGAQYDSQYSAEGVECDSQYSAEGAGYKSQGQVRSEAKHVAPGNKIKKRVQP